MKGAATSREPAAAGTGPPPGGPGRFLDADVDEILIDRHRIAQRVAELGAEIRRDLEDLADDTEIVLVPVLMGSIIFVADLIRQLPQKLRIEVVTASSYPGTATRSQGPRIAGPCTRDLSGRHVLIVDDILDSGSTLKLIRQELARQSPRTLRACVLLRKQRPVALATPCEYIGFDIPDVFVVGYGLDYNNYYRNLPDIGTLKEEAM